MELQNRSKIGVPRLDRRRSLTDGAAAESKQTFVRLGASAKGSDQTLGRSKQVVQILLDLERYSRIKFFGLQSSKNASCPLEITITAACLQTTKRTMIKTTFCLGMGSRNYLFECYSCQSRSRSEGDASSKQGNSPPLAAAEQ